MFNYIKSNESRLDIRSGNYNQNNHGYFFKTPGDNWFYQPVNGKEITYQELRRLYNKLYQLNRKK